MDWLDSDGRHRSGLHDEASLSQKRVVCWALAWTGRGMDKAWRSVVVVL